MPDILIRGMEMPKTCPECGFRCYDPHRQPSDGLGKGTNVCWFTQEEIWNTQRGERCPLIELPPHGDLIEAEHLKETLDYYIREAGWGDEINMALRWVKDEFIESEPVIAPSNNEDADG